MRDLRFICLLPDRLACCLLWIDSIIRQGSFGVYHVRRTLAAIAPLGKRLRDLQDQRQHHVPVALHSERQARHQRRTRSVSIAFSFCVFSLFFSFWPVATSNSAPWRQVGVLRQFRQMEKFQKRPTRSGIGAFMLNLTFFFSLPAGVRLISSNRSPIHDDKLAKTSVYRTLILENSESKFCFSISVLDSRVAIGSTSFCP